MQAQLILSVLVPLTPFLGQEEHGAESQATLVLQKSLVVQAPVVRDISDMRVLDGGGSAEHALIAGTCGAFVLDLATETATEEVAFELSCPPLLPSMIMHAEEDGQFEFARFSAGWTGPTAVIARDGRTRWESKMPGACSRPFDLDGDGSFEILVAEANSSQVRLLDHDGGVLWDREWSAANIEAAACDVDGDGESEILYVDGKALRICGRDGVELFTTAPPEGGYVNAIESVGWDDVLGGASILVGAYAKDAQWFFAYEADAKTYLAKYTWEQIAPFVRAERIERDGGDLFLTIENHRKQAFPAGFESSRLRLSISDKQGRVIFEDWLPLAKGETAAADGAIAFLNQMPLRFLVGYGDSVWMYVEP